MATVIWRREALEMRKSILAYGTERFGRSAARKLNQTIHRHIRLLAANPRMGQRLPEFDTPLAEVRKLQLTPIFMLLYTLDDKCQVIDILTIWDARRNPSDLYNYR